MGLFFIFLFFWIGISTSNFLIWEKKFSFSPQKCKLELCMSNSLKVMIYLSLYLSASISRIVDSNPQGLISSRVIRVQEHTTRMLISKIHLKKTCSMKRENNFLKLTWFYIMKTSTSPNSDVYLFWYKVFSSSSSISAVQWPTKQNCVGTGHSRLDNNKRLEEN